MQVETSEPLNVIRTSSPRCNHGMKASDISPIAAPMKRLSVRKVTDKEAEHDVQ